MSDDDDLELLPEKTVSALTGISIRTLQWQRYRKTGIPYVKVGKSVRYRRGDIRQYVAGNTVTSQLASAE